MLDREILERPDFLEASAEVVSRIGSLICEAKGVPPVFAGTEFGALIGDPAVAPAAAYSALKNRIGLRDACIATLAFHCHYKANNFKRGGLLSFALSRSKQKEAAVIAQIMKYLEPQSEEVLGRIDYAQFLGDSGAYLRSAQ